MLNQVWKHPDWDMVFLLYEEEIHMLVGATEASDGVIRVEIKGNLL